MPDIVRLTSGTQAEWAAAGDPIIPDRMPVAESDTGRMKIGDGIHHYSELPFIAGETGPPGPPGDFSYAADLIGTSVSSLTIQQGVHNLIVTTDRSWVPGMFICVARTSDATKYMIGQCLSYNKVTGAMALNVTLAVYGSGTFTDWTVSYAASAGSSVEHANTHLTGGYDEIPLATDEFDGLFSKTDFIKLSRMNINGIFIQEAQPNMLTGDVWYCTADLINTNPTIQAIYPRFVMVGDALTIPIVLNDAYDVSAVHLGLTASSNTEVIPIASISFRGYGSNRFMDIEAITSVGSSAITITATNFLGLVDTCLFTVTAVSEACTLTVGASGNGTVIPSGTILVPRTSDVTFTFIPDSGYALLSLDVDTDTLTNIDTYSLNDIQTNHTITANFALGYNINATAIGNGTIVPSGNVGVAAGSLKTFTFIGNIGYEADQFFVDGGAAQDASGGSHTFTGITTSHTISVNFKALMFDVSWSNITNGTVNSQVTGSVTVAYNSSTALLITPSTNYECYSINGDGVPLHTLVHSTPYTYTLPAVVKDTLITVSFRVQIPAVVTQTVVGNNNELTVTWNAAARATSYNLYWKYQGTGAVDGTWTQSIGAASGITIAGLTNGYTYSVVIESINTTGSVFSSIVTGIPINNLIPSGVLTASFAEFISTTSAAKFITNGTSTGNVTRDYTLTDNTLGIFEIDIYDFNESNVAFSFSIFGETAKTTAAVAGFYSTIYASNYRTGVTKYSGTNLIAGSRSKGWHRFTINATGDANSTVSIDGIEYYRGLLADSGVGSTGGRVIRIGITTLSSDAVQKSCIFANLTCNGTPISLGSATGWTSILALGSIQWGA